MNLVLVAEGTTNPGIVTSDMVQPIVSMISGNVTALVPVGITIMGIMIGVSMIPRIIYKFL